MKFYFNLDTANETLELKDGSQILSLLMGTATLAMTRELLTGDLMYLSL